MILFIRKKKKKIYFNFDDKPSNPISNNITDFQNLLAEKKNNSITMLYSLQKKKDSVLFNPEKINLTKGEYEIEVLALKDEDNNSISRKLNDIDYKFISDINGQMEIRITFFVQLTSMSELFKGCRNLLEVDLSNLDGSKLTDANSVFENCDNLIYINFTLKNGTNIHSMDNCFSGCQKLKDVDLTNFEPQNNVSIQNMFKNCINLIYVDLSKFQTSNYKGLFEGAYNIIINININDFNNTSTIKNLSDIINILKETKVECEIGEGQKCKYCMGGMDSHYCGLNSLFQND